MWRAARGWREVRGRHAGWLSFGVLTSVLMSGNCVLPVRSGPPPPLSSPLLLFSFFTNPAASVLLPSDPSLLAADPVLAFFLPAFDDVPGVADAAEAADVTAEGFPATSASMTHGTNSYLDHVAEPGTSECTMILVRGP